MSNKPTRRERAAEAPEPPEAGDAPAPNRSPRELIVVAKPGAGLRAGPAGVASVAGAEVAPLAKTLADEGVTLRPLFGLSEDHLQAEAEAAAPGPAGKGPDLSVYYRVDAPDAKLDDLAEKLRGHADVIAGAYVKPPGEPPVKRPEPAVRLSAAGEPPGPPPPVTPDFTARQGYLDAAPGGIDARYTWTLPGGRGAGVRIIDCEWAWQLTHEDLKVNKGGVIFGASTGNTDHGTAVLGEFGGDRNTIGVTGICSDANVRFSYLGNGSAPAIRAAADNLGPGDIILLEIHRAGPRHNFQARADQLGYIAIEWWPDDFDAIRYAVNKGIIVVEAGGNGAENLDDSLYDTPAAGFPADWKNAFKRSGRDSGAVVVGAGAPPPNTHGHDWGPDRSRLDFSNHGAVIDAQGWGREVTSTGYGDLQGGAGTDANRWYTDTFGGTSSASPIIVGALGCVQGVLRAQGRIPLEPARARELLRSTGSAQQDAPGRPSAERIGNRPNLRQLVAQATATGFWTGVQFTGTVAAGATQCFFTFNWPAHWHVAWSVVPTNVGNAPQISWRTRVQRASDGMNTYWICVTNVSGAPATIEGRFAVLGW